MTLSEFLSEWNAPSPLLKVHTSGSTGVPKELWVEKQRMIASARITCNYLGLKKGDSALLCMPLEYIAGKMMVVRSIERDLNLIVVEPSSHPLKGMSSAPDFAAMVPMQVRASLQVEEEAELLRQVRHLIIGGGSIDSELAIALHKFPNAVWSTYGMTETLSHIALRRLNGPEADDYYTPFEGVRLSVSPDGCLIIDAPEVCSEQLVTNDIAEILPDRRFRIMGRRDNTINTGGIKVQIEEVERRMIDKLPVQMYDILHDSFRISSRNHPMLGEEVVVVYLETLDSFQLEILRTSANSLPKYWQPRAWLPIAQLPLTETGKPNRAKIKFFCQQY